MSDETSDRQDRAHRIEGHSVAEALRPAVLGSSWSLSVGHPIVAVVAAEVFAAGGNAVDAGVAASIASTVVQVDMCNFGGIAPMLVRPDADSSVVSIAGVGRWSQQVDVPSMRDLHGDAIPPGASASIVPGAPAALLAALAEFGTKTWEEVCEPSIALAADGFVIDGRLAVGLNGVQEEIAGWPGSTAAYAPRSGEWREGDLLRQPELAQTLTTIARAERAMSGSTRREALQGAHRAFYEGGIAEHIADFVSSAGGTLGMENLAAFRAEISVAPSVSFREWQVASTPSWSQGPVALITLAVMEELHRRGYLSGLDRSEVSSWLVRVVDEAFVEREKYLCDPDVMSPRVEDLLSAAYVEELADRVLQPGNDVWQPQSSGTTAVVTMDSQGCVFSCTPSDMLNIGPIIPSLGIVCSPRGIQSRLDSEHPNRVRPGRRPCVTPSSLIAIPRGRSGGAWALASPGGDVIVQAISQVFWAVEMEGATLQSAVEEPRWASEGFPNAFSPHLSRRRSVLMEPGVPEGTRQTLVALGYEIRNWPELAFAAGSVQTVRDIGLPHQPVLASAADPRRSAYALAH